MPDTARLLSGDARRPAGDARRQPEIERPRVRAARPSPSFVALGDLALDVSVLLREPLASGSDTPAAVRFLQGGSAANTARMGARLGGRATFVGAVGRDRWGGVLVGSLRDAGVTVHAPRVAAPTARIVVVVAPGGERSFATQRGAADRLEPAQLQPSWFRRDALHLPGYSLYSEPLREAALAAVGMARASGAAVSVDLASARPVLARGRQAVRRDLVTLAPDLLFGNADEAAALTGGWRRDALLELAPVVALKQGRSGCLVLVRRGRDALALAVAARALEGVDTTGAGDAFDAGFLLSWLAVPPASRHDPRVLRSAALAGHRAAHRHLSGARLELEP